MNPVSIIPSIGRIVHFVMPDGQHRPAIIVHVWHHPAEAATPESLVNLQVFPDGTNDMERHELHVPTMLWRTSIAQQPEGMLAGTWHAPERAPMTAELESLQVRMVSLPFDELAALKEEALQVCYKVEACGASTEITAASAAASNLHQKLQALVRA